MKRFDFDTNDICVANDYILNRAIQLLKYGVVLKSVKEIEIGVDATFEFGGEEYHGIYVLQNFRNKGLYLDYVRKNKFKIITHIDCKIEDYLKKHAIEYVCLGEFEQTEEYKCIQEFYEDDCAKRSGVFFMNHIDEGLAILFLLRADTVAKKAYTLHPIFQSDKDLKENYRLTNSFKTSPSVILNAIEYRSVANEYLSTRKISSIDEIRLSPLKSVNDMLIADKIQNFKDFELYHKGKHSRSKELEEYFNNWLLKLEVKSTYQYFKEKLQINHQTNIKSCVSQ